MKKKFAELREKIELKREKFLTVYLQNFSDKSKIGFFSTNLNGKKLGFREGVHWITANTSKLKAGINELLGKGDFLAINSDSQQSVLWGLKFYPTKLSNSSSLFKFSFEMASWGQVNNFDLYIIIKDLGGSRELSFKESIVLQGKTWQTKEYQFFLDSTKFEIKIILLPKSATRIAIDNIFLQNAVK